MIQLGGGEQDKTWHLAPESRIETMASPSTYFNNEWDLFTFEGKYYQVEEVEVVLLVYSMGRQRRGSVERDVRSRFWVEASALQEGMKTEQRAEQLFGSGNWIESQIFYLSAVA